MADEATTDVPGDKPDVDTKPAGQKPADTKDEQVRLPDDHPLVKAYQATKNDLTAVRGKVKEFEDRDKSETDKLKDDLAAAQDDATTGKAEVARLKAAIKHGLSEDDLDLLGTGTPDEIEARAERLAKRLADSAPANGKRPVTSLGKPTEGSVDPDTWLRDLARR